MLHLVVSATRATAGSGLGDNSESTRGTPNEAHQLVPRTQNYSVFTKATIFKFSESKNQNNFYIFSKQIAKMFFIE
jgi:hypothetical protein